MEDDESTRFDPYLTREIILDLSPYENIVVRRITKSNAYDITVRFRIIIYYRLNLYQVRNVRTYKLAEMEPFKH